MIYFKVSTADQDWLLAECYINLLKQRMDDGEGALFHALEVVDLVKRDAYICVAFRAAGSMSASPVGYLHYVIDGEPRQQIMGLVVDPAARGAGIGTSLIAYARCHAANLNGNVLPAACIVRVLPDGRVNEASLRSFLRVGFVADEIIKIAIEGSSCDAHLIHSQEEDGTYRAQRLRASVTSFDIAAGIFGEGINSQILGSRNHG